MACSLKLNSVIVLKNIYFARKPYPLIITSKRHFCSKNDDSSSKKLAESDKLKIDKETSNKADEFKKDVSPENLGIAAKKILSTKAQTDLRAAARKRLLNSIAPENLKAAAEARKKIRSGSSSDLRSQAKNRLMGMLKKVKEPDEAPLKDAPKLNLSRPLKRISKKERLEIMKKNQITPEKQMDMAVKEVASTFEKGADQVESELKQKLSSLYLTQKSMEDVPEKNVTKLDDEVSEKVMSSVKEVATTISESPIPARSVLANRLLRMSVEKRAGPAKTDSLKLYLDKMKTDRDPKPSALPKHFELRKPVRERPVMPKIDLFGSTPLNIFDTEVDTKAEAGNEFWQKLLQKERNLMTQFAPANGFEEMIMWTEQGKHWKFPIDNETEMGAEENVGFHEHVFLEKHLTGFPTKGPIRHFMEIVCVGLSKNPYITVERKIENIEWFRNYFKEKEEILRHTGAIE